MGTQPDYVTFDHRGRDELLSQIGGFAPLERSVFERLCNTWVPEIDAQRFLSGAEGSREQEQSALERLMSKLRTAEIGLLTTRDSPSGREVDKIVLTSKGSVEFWTATLEESIRRLVQKGYPLLPSEARLKERKALPPAYHIVDVEAAYLVASAGPEQATILRVRLMGDFRIVFTPGTSAALLERALLNFKQDLNERGIIEELARVMDIGIGELRGRLESKTPDVWLDITRRLIKERGTIAYRKNLDEHDEFFQLAYLIMVWTDAQIGAARERKEYEQSVTAELEKLCAALLEARGGTLSRDEFTALVDDAQARLGPAAALFARRLTDEVLSPRPRRKLPRVLYLNGQYIHASRVRSTFESARSEMAEKLSRQYLELMEAFLRGRNTEVGEMFGSRELFREDVLRRVERQQPLLGEMIARPQVVAEAVILETKERSETTTPEDLKASLAGYFDVGSSKLRPPEDLFAISIVDIYDAAFAEVGVFRQFVLRIGGRHESLRATYIRRFGPKASRTSYADDGQAAPPTGRTRPAPVAPSTPTGTRVRGTGNRSYRPETVKAQRHQAPSAPAAPKQKSREEIEKSWKEFDKALRSKPSEKGST